MAAINRDSRVQRREKQSYRRALTEGVVKTVQAAAVARRMNSNLIVIRTRKREESRNIGEKREKNSCNFSTCLACIKMIA